VFSGERGGGRRVGEMGMGKGRRRWKRESGFYFTDEHGWGFALLLGFFGSKQGDDSF
jgi:hypothetical protein